MESKVFVVTSASRGIGLVITKCLLGSSRYVNVIVAGRLKEALDNLEIIYPGWVKIALGDFEDCSEPQRLVTLASETFYRIDGLVLNHGTLHPGKRIVDSTIEEWKSAFDVYFFSMTQQAIPHPRRTRGCIIFTSSGAAESVHAAWEPYSASKASLNNLPMTLAVEEPTIRSLAVQPGVVNTEMQRKVREVYASAMNEKDVAFFEDLHQRGHLLNPEEPGRAIATLVLNCPQAFSGKCVKWNDADVQQALA